MEYENEPVLAAQSCTVIQPLDAAVRRALAASTAVLRASVVALGFATVSAHAAAFPPIFFLSGLWPSRGGDGSDGFVLAGPSGTGGHVSDAGDVNGDGIDDILVSAPRADTLTGEGQIYVIFGTAQGFKPIFPVNDLFGPQGGDGSAGFVLGGIDRLDAAGGGLSGAGDFNGDGIADVLIGAAAADSAGHDYAGESYVVFGRTRFKPALSLAWLLPVAGGDGSRGIVLPGIRPYDRSGQPVSRAGDVNGDGIDDVIIGSECAGPDDRGETYVVFGSPAGFEPILPLVDLLPERGGDGTRGFAIRGIYADGCAGVVAAAGDVNADGIDDVIVGAPRVNHGQDRFFVGEAYVVFGRHEGFAPVFELAGLLPGNGGDGSAGFVLEAIRDREEVGYSVDGAGDVNGDGIDDVLIGAPFARDSKGQSYVVFGSDRGFPATIPLAGLFPDHGGDGSRGFVVEGSREEGLAGYVSAVGDVNADGIDDLGIGAPAWLDYRDPGESYVIYGRRDGFPPIMSAAMLFPVGGGDGSRGFALVGAPSDQAGYVSGAGDVNADGVDDLIIGAPSGGSGVDVSGVAYIVYGRADDTRR